MFVVYFNELVPQKFLYEQMRHSMHFDDSIDEKMFSFTPAKTSFVEQLKLLKELDEFEFVYKKNSLSKDFEYLRSEDNFDETSYKAIRKKIKAEEDEELQRLFKIFGENYESLKYTLSLFYNVV